MDLNKSIARNLDDPPRLLGMSPVELGGCALSYAVLNMTLRGVPFSALLSLGAALCAALFLRVVNLTRPPEHALHWIMCMLRPAVVPVMALDRDEKDL